MAEIKRIFLPGTEQDGLPAATEMSGILYARGILPIRYDNPRARIPEGIEQQTALALSHLDTVLTQAGLDRGRIVSIEIALANFARDFSRMDRLYQTTFGQNSPARSCVGVRELPEEALIQIDFSAAR